MLSTNILFELKFHFMTRLKLMSLYFFSPYYRQKSWKCWIWELILPESSMPIHANRTPSSNMLPRRMWRWWLLTMRMSCIKSKLCFLKPSKLKENNLHPWSLCGKLFENIYSAICENLVSPYCMEISILGKGIM